MFITVLWKIKSSVVIIDKATHSAIKIHKIPHGF